MSEYHARLERVQWDTLCEEVLLWESLLDNYPLGCKGGTMESCQMPVVNSLQGPLRDMLQKPRAISLLVCLWGPFLTPWRSLSFCLLSEEECSNIIGWATEGGFGAESGGKTTSTLLLCCIHNVMYYIYLYIHIKTLRGIVSFGCQNVV